LAKTVLWGRRPLRRIYVDLSFGVLKNSTGQVTGALAFARDATERYSAEKALRADFNNLKKQLPMQD
jgi:hypothetical protein